MKKLVILSAVVLASALVVGCNKDKTPTPTNGTATTRPSSMTGATTKPANMMGAATKPSMVH
jgi:hypothetical protein